MKVILNLNQKSCTILREPGDPKFHGALGAAGESRFLYHVKQALIKQGHDVIKKRMWKDGHLVDDIQQYVRTRSQKSGFMLWNSYWAIRGAEEDFNNKGETYLSVEVY